MAAPAAICNQLTAGLRQFGHFIFHSGRTVPQLWQDQMILGICCYLSAAAGRGALAVKLRRSHQATLSTVFSLSRGLSGIDQIFGKPAS
jgi:hypothetical protein